MPLLLFLARVFVNTFGITQPSPQLERRAAWFIGILLAVVVLLSVAALAAFLSIRR